MGGEAELALLLHIYPEGVEELDGAYAVYADEPPVGFDVVESGDVPEGWEDEWRSFHHGVRVGRLWVGPPWETVVIEPGRAFGTGAHPTTRLILGLLQDVERGSLLDVGCGSGVLSIAAAKLGFEPVTAIDVDAVAVEVTDANARANRVVVAASTVDASAENLPPAELAVANISLALVEAVAERLRSPRVVTAGYLASDRPRLAGFDHAGHRELEGWGADVFVAVPPDAVPL